MKKNIFLKVFAIAIVYIGQIACEQTKPEIKQQIVYSDATAYQDNSGLYIFIKSNPKHEIVQRFPTIKRNLIQEKIEEVKKMNLGQLIIGVPTALNEISFEKQVEAMIAITKEKHPEANGIIFSKLDEGTPIQFK